MILVVSNSYVPPCGASARLQLSEGRNATKWTIVLREPSWPCWQTPFSFSAALCVARQRAWEVEGANELHYFRSWCEDFPTELSVWWPTAIHLHNSYCCNSRRIGGRELGEMRHTGKDVVNLVLKEVRHIMQSSAMHTKWNRVWRK